MNKENISKLLKHGVVTFFVIKEDKNGKDRVSAA